MKKELYREKADEIINSMHERWIMGEVSVYIIHREIQRKIREKDIVAKGVNVSYVRGKLNHLGRKYEVAKVFDEYESSIGYCVSDWNYMSDRQKSRYLRITRTEVRDMLKEMEIISISIRYIGLKVCVELKEELKPFQKSKISKMYKVDEYGKSIILNKF